LIIFLSGEINLSKAAKKKKKVTCEFCGKEIPAARLKILPDTTTCVKCSQTRPYSESDILSTDVSKSQEENKLNLEDFENNDTDLSQYINSVE
jgi:hypothetical protein